MGTNLLKMRRNRKARPKVNLRISLGFQKFRIKDSKNECDEDRFLLIDSGASTTILTKDHLMHDNLVIGNARYQTHREIL